MSVTMTNYCIVGALLPYAPFKDDGWYDKLEPYIDALDGDPKPDDLCCIFDGMNGEFVAIGHVIAKSGEDGAFDVPIKLPETPLPENLAGLREKIIALIPAGVDVEIGRFVISHYR